MDNSEYRGQQVLFLHNINLEFNSFKFEALKCMLDYTAFYGWFVVILVYLPWLQFFVTKLSTETLSITIVSIHNLNKCDVYITLVKTLINICFQLHVFYLFEKSENSFRFLQVEKSSVCADTSRQCSQAAKLMRFGLSNRIEVVESNLKSGFDRRIIVYSDSNDLIESTILIFD